MKTYCILCQEELAFLEGIFKSGEDGMFCKNPSCPRFGLLTTVSTPMSKVEDMPESDEED